MYYELMNPCVHGMVKWHHRGVTYRDPEMFYAHDLVSHPELFYACDLISHPELFYARDMIFILRADGSTMSLF
ncbi:hypothetical protein F511_17052 [Dorcoceras hygrometricum]|uniref:Uncharacterized protein n=1 Tax=Dorcoceras hygrometricum TaxID=472368 RepID=A0A2Z7CYF1_9LAMI|nr:hypothetical protein F511_17052 [Dorcoceras hygrometricum]